VGAHIHDDEAACVLHAASFLPFSPPSKVRGSVHPTRRLVSPFFSPQKCEAACILHAASFLPFSPPSKVRGSVHPTRRLVSSRLFLLRSARRRAPHTPSRLVHFPPTFPPTCPLVQGCPRPACCQPECWSGDCSPQG
jgi:hypothetical protein